MSFKNSSILIADLISGTYCRLSRIKKKTPFDVIGNQMFLPLSSTTNSLPSQLPVSPPPSPPLPPPPFARLNWRCWKSQWGFAGRVNLKQSSIKSAYPRSLTVGVSYKSICTPANEGWKWRVLIGRCPDHSHSVNKASERKPVHNATIVTSYDAVRVNDAGCSDLASLMQR